MTDFDVISIGLKAPLHFMEFESSGNDEGHLIVETANEADAFLILFSFDNATLG